MVTPLFYGDPHGNWDALFEAVDRSSPDAVVLLGDMDLTCALHEQVRPVTDSGVPTYWIAGNHDGDDDAWYDRLFESELGDRDLNARTVDVGGLRIAGLGGVFRGKIWNPNKEEAPRFPDRATYLQQVPKGARWRGGLPRRHRVTVFPEDVEFLRTQRANVLVTHEAPSCHPNGFSIIDDLARDMGVSRVIHGHHHVRYEGWTRDGIPVTGLALAEPMAFNFDLK